MKVVNSILTVTALAVPAVVAQFPPDFPPCGVTCVTNMLNQAAALGCPSPDAKCLCTNQNFMYGIRDCSYQYCQNDTAAGSIVAYGIEYCKQAGVTVPTDTGAGATGGGAGGGSGGGSGGSAGATATGTGGGPGGAGSSVPVTTSAIVSTISSGGSVITSTVGSTTLFSVVGGGAGGNGGNGGSVPVSTSSFTKVITTDGSTITSTGASTIYSSASVSVTTSAIVSTIVSDGSTRVTTAGSTVVSSTARSTSTSSGLAPQKTAAPAGILAAAGLAALLL